MLRESDDPVCDVVGCDGRSAATYLDGAMHPGYRFVVCEDHRGRLLAGEKPEIVAARSELARMHGRLALILD